MAHAISHRHGNMFNKEQRLKKVAELLLKGYTHQQIADELGTTLRRVYRYKNIMAERLIKYQMIDYDKLVSIKREEYAKIKRECWEAFEASKKNSKGMPRQPNPVYLDKILAVLEAERRMLGLDKQKEDGNKSTVNLINWDSLYKGNVSVQENSEEELSATDRIIPKSLSSGRVSVDERTNDELTNRIEELNRRAVELNEIERKKEGSDLGNTDEELFDDPLMSIAKSQSKDKKNEKRVVLKSVKV